MDMETAEQAIARIDNASKKQRKQRFFLNPTKAFPHSAGSRRGGCPFPWAFRKINESNDFS